MDEPTRGVDVGSKADIYRILRDLAANGMALLVVSSDLPEVLALAHRIVVMSEGRVAGELDAATASEVSILELAAPAAQHGRAASTRTPTGSNRDRTAALPTPEHGANRQPFGKGLLVRVATDRPLLLIFLIVALIAVMTVLEPTTFSRRKCGSHSA